MNRIKIHPALPMPNAFSQNLNPRSPKKPLHSKFLAIGLSDMLESAYN
ncbi:MAG: hypothetical protein ACRC62_16985 [Microcoleus sp.]